MPYKPKRPCSYPSCPWLVSGRYCEEHQKIRDRYLAEHPLCEKCRECGRWG